MHQVLTNSDIVSLEHIMEMTPLSHTDVLKDASDAAACLLKSNLMFDFV